MLAAFSAAMIKQLTDKLYLQNIKNTIDAIQSPDHHAAKVAGGLAGNFVPYSSALHLINADPVMREADTFISAVLAKVPGFSQHFPARRDWAGDPITVHKGLWLDTPESKADAEVQRLALQQGSSIGAPSAKARGGADLRDITMAGDKDGAAKGMSAYDRYQELAGHPERMPGTGRGGTPKGHGSNLSPPPSTRSCLMAAPMSRGRRLPPSPASSRATARGPWPTSAGTRT